MTPKPTAQEQKSIELMQQKAVSMTTATITTEERLRKIRATMRFYRPAQTFGREHGRIQGYYYTEPTDPTRLERLTDGIVLKTRRV